MRTNKTCPLKGGEDRDCTPSCAWAMRPIGEAACWQCAVVIVAGFPEISVRNNFYSAPVERKEEGR